LLRAPPITARSTNIPSDSIARGSFRGDQRFSVADITALVTVDSAAKAINFPVPDEHRSLTRWYDVISSRSSMAA
jgi:glutathione S-transferase